MAPVDAKVIEPEVAISPAVFPSPEAVPVVSAAVAAPVMPLVLVMLIFPDVALPAVLVAVSALPVNNAAPRVTAPVVGLSVIEPLVAVLFALPPVANPVVIVPAALDVMLAPVMLIEPVVASLLVEVAVPVVRAALMLTAPPALSVMPPLVATPGA